MEWGCQAYRSAVVAFAAAQQAPQRVQPGGQRPAAVVMLGDPAVEGAVRREVGAARRAGGDPLAHVGERLTDAVSRAVAQAEAAQPPRVEDPAPAPHGLLRFL